MNVILRRASLNLTPRDKQRLTCAFCWRGSPLKALVTGCCMKNMAMLCESHRGLNLGAGLGLWCLWCWPPRLRAARTLWTRPFLQIQSPEQPENSFRSFALLRSSEQNVQFFVQCVNLLKVRCSITITLQPKCCGLAVRHAVHCQSPFPIATSSAVVHFDVDGW